jgi:hypothetical protein
MYASLDDEVLESPIDDLFCDRCTRDHTRITFMDMRHGEWWCDDCINDVV